MMEFHCSKLHKWGSSLSSRWSKVKRIAFQTIASNHSFLPDLRWKNLGWLYETQLTSISLLMSSIFPDTFSISEILWAISAKANHTIQATYNPYQLYRSCILSFSTNSSPDLSKLEFTGTILNYKFQCIMHYYITIFSHSNKAPTYIQLISPPLVLEPYTIKLCATHTVVITYLWFRDFWLSRKGGGVLLKFSAVRICCQFTWYFMSCD